MNKRKVCVLVSLDAEEEGLFGGEYRSRDVSVANIAELRELEPLKTEFGLPPTLFCSWPVFADRESARILEWARDRLDAEIGAHLHHWSTPPWEEGRRENEPPTRTHLLSPALLVAKLRRLLEAGEKVAGAKLTSFRMGRWDLKSRLLPLLAAEGIRVDCSVAPLRAFKDGPDHFLAPANPYWVDFPDGGKILEIPITQVPVFQSLPPLWRRLCGNGAALDKFHFFGAMSCNPFWHSQRVMRAAARACVARGGRMLSLFWHSSEMMPGGSPHTRTREDRDKFLKKIFSFFAWLRDAFDVVGVTASDPRIRALDFPRYNLSEDRDW